MVKLKNKQYVLSVSFGDYKHTAGGVAKVILAHQEMFNKNGISYICIFPLNLRNGKPVKNNRYWGIIVDGEFDTVMSTHALIAYFYRLEKEERNCECIHIHHLMRIDIQELSAIVQCFSCKIFFYLHDYYIICTSIKLIGSNGQLCTKDFLVPDKCKDCEFYESSLKMKNSLERFVKDVQQRIWFVCPSKAAQKYFLRQYRQYEDRTIVVYHQNFLGKYRIPDNIRKTIKIGYAGVPIAAKGWEQFKKLYKLYGETNQYDFVYFSSVVDTSLPIRNVQVDFKTSLTAMVDALRREKVDYVVLWSTWPETYSYTYYESYCAGCCVITNESSGNIADQVNEMQAGLILSQEELFAFFADMDRVADFRKKYISTKKQVFEILQENDQIVSMSACANSAWVAGEKQSGWNLAGRLLSFLYKTKLNIKKGGK